MNQPELFCPEFALLLGALLSFACTAIGTTTRVAWLVSITVALIAVGTSAVALSYQGQPFDAGMYSVDAFSQVLKLGISVALAFAIAISQRQDSTRASARTEVHFVLYLSALGLTTTLNDFRVRAFGIRALHSRSAPQARAFRQ